ncbi:hypothetical protein H312_03105 [Anncaliia algerae PRA339]|uniref:Uncharacterized protein n=1 Tax=Anncaliia algerae PRA339 TaxID=1288291 RepID=A0A059EX73_9MICR|nr:hypothetical protein H312_03105 [Anncaliia algerae PRA339]
MLTAYKIIELCHKMNEKELLDFFMDENYILKEMFCTACGNTLKLVVFVRSLDKYAWRCMNSECNGYKKYFSIRKNSFFEDIKIKLKDVLIILIKYSCKNQRNQIHLSMDYSEKTIYKIIKKFVSMIPETNFSNNKLGGPGK